MCIVEILEVSDYYNKYVFIDLSKYVKLHFHSKLIIILLSKTFKDKYTQKITDYIAKATH